MTPNLPATEDPNERFQERLFARYTNALPRVPAMNDLGWIPGHVHLADFAGPIGVTLYGAGSETTFYPAGTVLLNGWRGQIEMPIDTAVRKGDTATLNLARSQIESLLTNYAQTFTVGGDTCLYWQKPLSGAWLTDLGRRRRHHPARDRRLVRGARARRALPLRPRPRPGQSQVSDRH